MLKVFLFATLLWFSLSGIFSLAFLLFYVISLCAVLCFYNVFFRTNRPCKPDNISLSSLLNVALYISWLFKEIVKSAIGASSIVLSGRKSADILRQCCFVNVSCKGLNSLQVAIFANSITATPSTISVSAQEDAILVHCMNISSAQDLEGENCEMKNKVLKL